MQRVWGLSLGCAIAALPAIAGATELSDAAADLPEGEWVQLSTQDLLPAVAEPNGGATGSIFPYAESAVWDQATGQVIFVGSDHIYNANDSGPRMIRYSDQANTWTAHGIPWWSNGTMHGYDHAAMYQGALYQMTLIVDQPVYRYDPGTDAWEPIAALPYTGYNRFGGLAPFPELGGLVYAEGGGVFAYDVAADSWSEIASAVPMGDYHNFAEYSPPHGVVLLGGGNGSGQIHTLDPDLSLTSRGEVPFPLRVNDAIVTHDPNSGDFLIFGGDHQFLVYDVEADELLEQPSEVPFFDQGSAPVSLVVAAAIDSYGVVMFVEHNGISLDGEANVWLYRHSPGAGTPPPGGDDGGDDSSDSGDPADGDSDGGLDSGPDGGSDAGDDGPGPTTGASDPGGDGDDADDHGGSGGGVTANGADDDAAGGGGCRVGGERSGGLALGVLALLGLTRRRRRALVASSALALAACGSSSDDGPPDADGGDAPATTAEDTGDDSGDPDGGPGNPDEGSGDSSEDDDSSGDTDEPPPPAGGCFGPGEIPPTTGPHGFAMPTVDDERSAYESFGWTWDLGAEPSVPGEPGYTVSNPDIHGDTEGDDLWSYLMQYERTGEPGYLDRAEAWARYFKEDYASCTGSSDRSLCYDMDAFGADHLWGWGLIAYAEAFDDAEALAAAVQIGEIVDGLWAPNSPFGCLPSGGCTYYGVRQVGRHLLLVTRLAEVTGDPRWESLRDRIIDTLLASAEWDDDYGMYFYGDWATDGELGQGAHAAGARIVSAFQLGVLSEAFDHAYRVTGREQLRERMVAMAGFVDEYGLDETYRYTGSSFGIVGGAPYHNYSASEPVGFWDPVYTTSLVNVLMRGFRYTCDTRYYERAQEFFIRGNGGIYGEPVERAAPDDTVHHFVDTIFASATAEFYLDYNKGELQYTYLLFSPVP